MNAAFTFNSPELSARELLASSSLCQAPSTQVNDFVSTFWTDEPVNAYGKGHETLHAVVAAATSSGVAPLPTTPKPHRQLPKAPNHWKELDSHPYGEGFKEGARLEIRNLVNRGCWRVIPQEEAKTRPIPLKWVFTYKTNSSGELVRQRSRIVVRGDLQDEASIFSTYASTLAARSFRVLIALAARFDLEVKQFDVVNAFINAPQDPRSKPVTCYMPDGFKEKGKVVELDSALWAERLSCSLVQ